MNKPIEPHTTLWSIQPREVWRLLKREGVVRVQRDLIEPEYLSAYDWLVAQMRRRVGPAPNGVTYPMWAWQRWRGLTQPKPDLRVVRHFEQGRFVRLELNIETGRILSSDYDLWHYALSYWYLPASERDSLRFDRELKAAGLDNHSQRPLSHPEYHARIQASWERIFDLNWQQPYTSFPRAEKRLQATLWEIRLEDVVEVTPFVGALRDAEHRK